MSLIRYLHHISITVWIGGIVFFSFILTPLLFKNLAKEVVSQVLDLLFPKYYLLGYCCSLVALVTYFFLSTKSVVQLVLLVLMLGITFYAGLFLYPKAHQLKIELKSYASEALVPEQVRLDFKKTHRLAVILNMLVLILGLIYIALLIKLLQIPS